MAATDTRPIDRLLRRVSRELRLRRAERGALRGGFWGAVAAAAVFAAQGLLGAIAVPLAIGVAALGLVGGALFGAGRRVSRLEAARLADRALGLQDRVATLLEFADRPDRSPLVAALEADTAARVAQLAPRRMLGRTLPREARLLPLPVLAAAVLALMPPITGARAWIPDWLGGDAKEAERSTLAALEDRAATRARETLRRDPPGQRELAQSLARRPPPAEVESTAMFQDKALARSGMDFSSFLKQGDERLRMLENADRLPDLKSDFASSKYRMMLRQTRELSAAARRQAISPRKLAELLREMERLGRQGGNWEDEVRRGLEAVEQGLYDEGLEAMEGALDKLRDLEQRHRGSRGLQGGPDAGQANQEMEGMFGEGSGMEDLERQGAAPGFGSNPNWRGKPTARLRSTPYTSGVQGVRRGSRPGYESQMGGNAGNRGADRELAGTVGRYRRMMEDAITREQVPRDYHEQIRDYFQSLQER